MVICCLFCSNVTLRSYYKPARGDSGPPVGTAVAVCSNEFPGRYPPETVNERLCPHPVSPKGAERWPAGIRARSRLPNPGLRRSVPSRSQRTVPGTLRGRGSAGSGFGKQLPLLFPSSCGRSGGRCGKCRLREPGPRAPARGGWDPLRPGCLPPPCASGPQAPHSAAQGGRGQGRPCGCWPPPAYSWPRRLPGVLSWCQEHPESQVARMWAMGDGRRAPPRGPRGRRQGEGAGLCVSCSPGKQH